MKQNIWRRWKLVEAINTGSIDSSTKNLVLLYYWITLAYYFISPIDAYDINMKIEKHAYETYVKYSAYHPEDAKIAEIANDELEHARELKLAMSMIT